MASSVGMPLARAARYSMGLPGLAAARLSSAPHARLFNTATKARGASCIRHRSIHSTPPMEREQNYLMPAPTLPNKTQPFVRVAGRESKAIDWRQLYHQAATQKPQESKAGILREIFQYDPSLESEEARAERQAASQFTDYLFFLYLLTISPTHAFVVLGLSTLYHNVHPEKCVALFCAALLVCLFYIFGNNQFNIWGSRMENRVNLDVDAIVAAIEREGTLLRESISRNMSENMDGAATLSGDSTE